MEKFGFSTKKPLLFNNSILIFLLSKGEKH